MTTAQRVHHLEPHGPADTGLVEMECDPEDFASDVPTHTCVESPMTMSWKRMDSSLNFSAHSLMSTPGTPEPTAGAERGGAGGSKAASRREDICTGATLPSAGAAGAHGAFL